MQPKSLVEIAIDGFFTYDNNYKTSYFNYYMNLYFWLNRREICLCDCIHICKEYSCCKLHNKIVFHCPNCPYKKCKYCRRVEQFNKLYANLALNKTSKFIKYLRDLNGLIANNRRVIINFEYYAEPNFTFFEQDYLPVPWNRDYKEPSFPLRDSIKPHSKNCRKVLFNKSTIFKMYNEMFGYQNRRDYNCYKHLNYKEIPYFLKLFCSIVPTSDSITLLDYFMYILPFRYYNLTFFVNIPWNLV